MYPCKIIMYTRIDNYVDMQDNYVDMQDIYVYMQDYYVYMQDNYVYIITWYFVHTSQNLCSAMKNLCSDVPSGPPYVSGDYFKMQFDLSERIIWAASSTMIYFH